MVEDPEILQLRNAVAGLESQRNILGDAVVDTSISVISEKLKALEKRESAEQLRKFVTVLFADVSGFTSICQANDAENVTVAINKLWQALDRIVIAHGGTVDKHIGDCVMAVWGLEGVREDDPVRSVEAALAMQTAAVGISRDSDGLIPPFKIRIGIHSGPAFISPVGLKKEYTVMGDTVNVASRLQSYAPLGSVIISNDCWKHVRNDFSCREQPPVKFKGIDGDLTTFLVVSPLARQFSNLSFSVLGIETSMVGRAVEMNSLLEKFNGAVSSGVTAMVTVLGEAGIGKSRLLNEFRKSVEKNGHDAVFFNARCTPGMIDIPCAVFRDILRFSFSVREDDSTAVVFEKLESGMGTVLESREIHLACHFAGFDMSSSPHVNVVNGDSSLAAAGRTALLRYFRKVAGNARTLVYLEDLHWADSVSLGLIEQIVREISGCRLLVLCLARPPLLERQPDWGADLPNTFIHLKPLASSESRNLITEILQKVKGMPDSLIELIADNTDGNPFYVEELIKMLVEEGIVSLQNGSVDSDALGRRKMPSSLTGVLQARLDSLPGSEKELLQMASVVGRIFWDKTVRELCTDQDHGAVDGMLGSLEEHDLVHRLERSAFSDTGEYLFKHAILRDVTYETVLLRRRKNYHRLVARWLLKNAGERVSEFASQIADHFEKARDWQNAVEWLVRSGRAAMSTSAYREALSRFRRTLAIPDSEKDIPLKARLLLDCGACLEKLCLYDEAREVLNEAISLSSENCLHKIAAESLLVLTWIMLVTGDRSSAGELASEAYRKALDSGDKATQARAYMRLADFEESREYDKVMSYYSKASTIYREIGDKQGIAISLLNLGNAALGFGQMDKAWDCYSESLELYTGLGHRWGIANCLGNLGCVSSDRKEHTLACEYFRKSLAVSERIGDREGEVICNLNLAQSALSLKKTFEAFGHLETSVSIACSVGLRPLALEALRCKAEALIDMGETERALLILFVVREDDALAKESSEAVSRILEDLSRKVEPVVFERLKEEAGLKDASDFCSDKH